jgi:hypothetical protein
MTNWLMNLIPGGWLTVIAGSAIALLGVLWRMLAGAKKAGRDEQLVKEAKARAKNLEDVKRAQDAAARVDSNPAGELSDPNNRDLRR